MSKADDFFDFAWNELAGTVSIPDDILESLTEEARAEYGLTEADAHKLIGEALLYEAKDRASLLGYECRLVEGVPTKSRRKRKVTR